MTTTITKVEETLAFVIHIPQALIFIVLVKEALQGPIATFNSFRRFFFEKKICFEVRKRKTIYEYIKSDYVYNFRIN